eukprot:g45423.t1
MLVSKWYFQQICLSRQPTTNVDKSLGPDLEVTKKIDEGRAVDIVYLDFRKAFDKVSLGRLISKVRSPGIWEEVADMGIVTRHLEKYMNKKCLEGYGASSG